jgi:hypothetical protein
MMRVALKLLERSANVAEDPKVGDRRSRERGIGVPQC